MRSLLNHFSSHFYLLLGNRRFDGSTIFQRLIRWFLAWWLFIVKYSFVWMGRLVGMKIFFLFSNTLRRGFSFHSTERGIFFFEGKKIDGSLEFFGNAYFFCLIINNQITVTATFWHLAAFIIHVNCMRSMDLTVTNLTMRRTFQKMRIIVVFQLVILIERDLHQRNFRLSKKLTFSFI